MHSSRRLVNAHLKGVYLGRLLNVPANKQTKFALTACFASQASSAIGADSQVSEWSFVKAYSLSHSSITHHCVQLFDFLSWLGSSKAISRMTFISMQSLGCCKIGDAIQNVACWEFYRKEGQPHFCVQIYESSADYIARLWKGKRTVKISWDFESFPAVFRIICYSMSVKKRRPFSIYIFWVIDCQFLALQGHERSPWRWLMFAPSIVAAYLGYWQVDRYQWKVDLLESRKRGLEVRQEHLALQI